MLFELITTIASRKKKIKNDLKFSLNSDIAKLIYFFELRGIWLTF